VQNLSLTHKLSHTNTPGTAYADSMMLAGFNVGWASIGTPFCVCMCMCMCVCVCVCARVRSCNKPPRNLRHTIIAPRVYGTCNEKSHTPLDMTMIVPITLVRNKHLPHICTHTYRHTCMHAYIHAQLQAWTHIHTYRYHSLRSD